MHDPNEEYDGPATVDPDGPAPLPVRVRLRGRFEPIDGRFHWYGRIDRDPALEAQHDSGDDVVLATPHGRATGRISDVDTWGRFRVTGSGTPPF